MTDRLDSLKALRSPVVKACRKCGGSGYRVKFPGGRLTYKPCSKCQGARGRFGYRPGMERYARMRRSSLIAIEEGRS